MNKEKPAFIPKALFTICGRSSDSLLEVCRLPETLDFSGIVTDLRAHSSGNCPGISPDSLLSLIGTINRCKYTKFLYYKSISTETDSIFPPKGGFIFLILTQA